MMFYLFLLVFFCRGVYSQPIFPTILFRYQSQGIPYPVWSNLLTLCLAPLIAHVAGGVESPTILGSASQGPSWSAYLTHFNPISIVWRYYIIADRRIRARSWDQCDMAACNAVFWDAEYKCWDGSEEMMVKSRAWITKMPHKAHIRILSASSMLTLVLTWQGIDIMFIIVDGFAGGTPHIPLGLGGLFVALQTLALMRLPAALWLSSDYGYLNFHRTEMVPDVGETPLEKQVRENILEARISNHLEEVDVGGRLLPRYSRQGILYRSFWLLTLWGILGPAATSCSEVFWQYPPSLPYCSSSYFVWQVMYLVLSLSGILIHTTYVIRGKTHSTIIPCVHATWYKIFTMFLILIMIICAVLSCLETRIGSDGVVTTFPDFQCGEAGALCYPVGNGQGNTGV